MHLSLKYLNINCSNTFFLNCYITKQGLRTRSRISESLIGHSNTRLHPIVSSFLLRTLGKSTYLLFDPFQASTLVAEQQDTVTVVQCWDQGCGFEAWEPWLWAKVKRHFVLNWGVNQESSMWKIFGSCPACGQKLKGAQALVVDQSSFFMFVSTLYCFSLILFSKTFVFTHLLYTLFTLCYSTLSMLVAL